ncbi:MAG: hypothetical protein ACP5HK_06495 [Acidilobus sp.]
MWYTAGVVYIATLSIADFALFNYIGFDPKVSYVEFSVISGAWSAAFIAANELLGRFADAGEHGRLAFLSSAMIALSALLFGLARGNVIILGLAYVAHAAATASANLAFSTSVFELTPADSWELRSSIQRLGLYSLRGMGLLLLALITPAIGAIGPVGAALALAASLGLSFSFLLPPSMPLLERKLGKAFRGLSVIGVYSASVAAFIGDRYGLLCSISEGVKGRSSPVLFGMAAAFASFVGDYFLTALPLYLRTESFTFQQYSLTFGIAGLVASIGLVLIDATSISVTLVAGLVVTRGLWMSLTLGYVRDLSWLGIYVAVSLVLFASVEMTLYRLFVREASGYGVHTYAVLKEFGSLAGSVAGGVALLGGSYVFIGLPLVSTLASAALLLFNGRVKI